MSKYQGRCQTNEREQYRTYWAYFIGTSKGAVLWIFSNQKAVEAEKIGDDGVPLTSNCLRLSKRLRKQIVSFVAVTRTLFRWRNCEFLPYFKSNLKRA